MIPPPFVLGPPARLRRKRIDRTQRRSLRPTPAPAEPMPRMRGVEDGARRKGKHRWHDPQHKSRCHAGECCGALPSISRRKNAWRARMSARSSAG